MIKILIAATLIFIVQNIIDHKIPDAIRCGADNSCCDGAIYIVHAAQQTKAAHYCQVYSPEHRCVNFNADGSYNAGVGHYDSRRGC